MSQQWEGEVERVEYVIADRSYRVFLANGAFELADADQYSFDGVPCSVDRTPYMAGREIALANADAAARHKEKTGHG